MKIKFASRATQDLVAIEGVRKLVTRRYPYLVYYMVDDQADEIIILAIQHPAQEHEQSDI